MKAITREAKQKRTLWQAEKAYDLDSGKEMFKNAGRKCQEKCLGASCKYSYNICFSNLLELGMFTSITLNIWVNIDKLVLTT